MADKDKIKIVMLAGRGESSSIVYHKLSEVYEIQGVISEEPVSRITFLRRRVYKLGVKKVLGQILFSLLRERKLYREAEKRRQFIIEHYGLNTSKDYLDSDKCIKVKNANSEETVSVLKRLRPDIVVVNGTRILSETVLNSCDAFFINMHAGFTPKYRGVHGAYWAFYENDPEHAGVTIHLVDKGIDTGGILLQEKIEIATDDNFTTYPLLQTAKGVKLEIKAIEMLKKHEVKTISNGLPSVLRTHPTIWEYDAARRRGIK